MLFRFRDRQCKNLECCESNDPRCVDDEEDWNVACSESNDPVARCLFDELGSESETSPNALHGDDAEAMTGRGEGPEPTEHDIAMFKAAKRREHFEGMVPGSLTPYPWRSIFHGRGRVLSARDDPAASPVVATYNMAG